MDKDHPNSLVMWGEVPEFPPILDEAKKLFGDPVRQEENTSDYKEKVRWYWDMNEDVGMDGRGLLILDQLTTTGYYRWAYWEEGTRIWKTRPMKNPDKILAVYITLRLTGDYAGYKIQNKEGK